MVGRCYRIRLPGLAILSRGGSMTFREYLNKLGPVVVVVAAIGLFWAFGNFIMGL
jgi:hypothetical protein